MHFSLRVVETKNAHIRRSEHRKEKRKDLASGRERQPAFNLFLASRCIESIAPSEWPRHGQRERETQASPARGDRLPHECRAYGVAPHIHTRLRAISPLFRVHAVSPGARSLAWPRFRRTRTFSPPREASKRRKSHVSVESRRKMSCQKHHENAGNPQSRSQNRMYGILTPN